jgi:hypothetical protein
MGESGNILSRRRGWTTFQTGDEPDRHDRADGQRVRETLDESIRGNRLDQGVPDPLDGKPIATYVMKKSDGDLCHKKEDISQ